MEKDLKLHKIRGGKILHGTQMKVFGIRYAPFLRLGAVPLTGANETLILMFARTGAEAGPIHFVHKTLQQSTENQIATRSNGEANQFNVSTINRHPRIIYRKKPVARVSQPQLTSGTRVGPRSKDGPVLIRRPRTRVKTRARFLRVAPQTKNNNSHVVIKQETRRAEMQAQ